MTHEARFTRIIASSIPETIEPLHTMKKTITYLETPFSGLIPANLVERFKSNTSTPLDMVRLRITQNKGAYHAGEIVECEARSFVRVTSRRKYSTWVATVTD